MSPSCIAVFLATAALLKAQQRAPNIEDSPLRFEVASVRPCGPGGLTHTVHLGFTADGYTATSATLELLLESAYGVDERQIIAAPAWVKSKEFDIEARIDATTVERLRTMNEEQRTGARQHMLQALFADRFGLVAHNETRELPIYSLVVARNGPKLQEAKLGNTYANGVRWPDGSPAGPGFVGYQFYGGDVEMKGQAASLNMLINRLTQKSSALHLERKIVDSTGLTGSYDFDLHFKVPWPSEARIMSALDDRGIANQDKSGDRSDSADLSVFTAFKEQLGLKMEATKGLVEVVVVDHVEAPSEN